MNITHRCMVGLVAASAIAPAYSQSHPPEGAALTVMPPVVLTPASAGIASVSHAPSGQIYFSTPDRNIIDRSGRHMFGIGLRYQGSELGVQGIELTIEIPDTIIAVQDVRFGSAITSPDEWTLDYNVRRTRRGATLKIIAFGRDTTVGIGAGSYDDLFRVSFAVAPPGSRRIGAQPAVAEIAILDVASALAHSLGHSAGVVVPPERSVLRLTIVRPTPRGDVRIDDHNGYLAPAGIADAAGAEGVSRALRIGSLEMEPERDGTTAGELLELLPHETGMERSLAGERSAEGESGNAPLHSPVLR